MGISSQDYQDVKITVQSAGVSVLEGISDKVEVQWQTGTVPKRPLDAPDELTVFTGPTIGEMSLTGLSIPAEGTAETAALEDPSEALSIVIESADSGVTLLTLSECMYRNGYEEGGREEGSDKLGRALWERVVKFAIIKE